MKNICISVDETQLAWFKGNHIKMAPWIRSKMFEYIYQNGGTTPIESK